MAGLIPQQFIQDLLARTDIVQVIGERLQLKKAGKEYSALSPFTNEKTPSFTVSPQKQFYHCFSSGKHGTAITFLMEYERLTFVEAVEDLARRAGLSVPREGGSTAPALVLDGPLDALAAAERIYKAELKKHPAAIEYLKQRGVTGETAKRFGIGFAPAGWDTLAAQFPQPGHALDAGLLVKNDQGRIYDFYRNRVMFPVRDTRGRVITFGGRVMPGSDDPRKYLNGRETALFNKSRNLYGLYEAREGTGAIPYLLVVEGYMDCAMLHQHGLTNAVATLGTATTREHLTLLFKSSQQVVFCFDGDRAGRAAAWRALEQALPEVHEGRECRFMFLPQGQDPDTHVQAIGADAFRREAEEAKTLASFLIEELSGQVNLSAPDGRARLAALARPLVSKMREGALRSLILEELTRLTRLPRAELVAAMTVSAATTVASADAGDDPLAGDSARPARRALQLLLNRPDLAERVSPTKSLPIDAPGAGLLGEALEFFREHEKAHAGQLLELWRDRPYSAAVNRLAAASVELESEAVEQEFLEQINKLSHRHWQRDMAERVGAILNKSQQGPLTVDEQREVDQIKAQLAGRKGV